MRITQDLPSSNTHTALLGASMHQKKGGTASAGCVHMLGDDAQPISHPTPSQTTTTWPVSVLQCSQRGLAHAAKPSPPPQAVTMHARLSSQAQRPAPEPPASQSGSRVKRGSMHMELKESLRKVRCVLQREGVGTSNTTTTCGRMKQATIHSQQRPRLDCTAWTAATG